MKHQNSKKRGFTLVELLVVIAILAVLATVSIVGYTSFIEKAQISNDQALLKQLNTILQATAIEEGHNATAQDAIDDCEDNGYVVTKITPTADGNNILWDSKNDCFVYENNGELEYIGIDKAESTADTDYFMIYNSELQYNSSSENNTTTGFNLFSVNVAYAAGENNYSAYLGDGALDNYTETSITTSVGIDLGNYNIDVTYEGTAEVIIRAGAASTITIKGGTVNLYGEALEMIVSGGNVAVNGDVTTVTVEENSSATLTAKDGSSIDNLKVNSTTAKVEIASNAEVNSIVAVSSENIQSATNAMVILTTEEATAVATAVNTAIADFGKIVGKASKGEYTEETYLSALSSAGITDVSLYFDTEYVVSGNVETVEIDDVSYRATDTTRHSMNMSAYVTLNAFKIDTSNSHLLIDKVLYFAALVNNETLKINGERVPLKWDAYTGSEQSLTALNFKFKSGTNGSCNYNNGTVEITYTGTYTYAEGLFTFTYDQIASTDILLWKKVKNGTVTYSWDKVENGTAGMYPFSPSATKDYSYSETKTLYVFASDGTFKGVVGPLEFECNYYTGN